MAQPLGQIVRECRTCSEVKNIDDYHNIGERGKGYRALDCKPCTSDKNRQWRRDNVERLRAYERRPERRVRRISREKEREISRAWRAAHLGHRSPSYGTVYFRPTAEAARAHYAVVVELRAGRMVRPDACSRCGRSAKMIEAAHHDYAKPLDIEWLCRHCHRTEDSASPKGGVRRA